MVRVGLRRFVVRWGWRPYALPILTVVTVVALLSSTGGSPAPPKREPAAPASARGVPPPAERSDIALKDDVAGPNIRPGALKAAQLPAGVPYTAKGAGSFRIVPDVGAAAGAGPIRRYTIEVEVGLSDRETGSFAAKVVATLADRRSWIAGKGVALQRTDDRARADWSIVLTTPMTVRSVCGYEIHVETSCWDGAHRRVVINVARWMRGAAAYVGDVDAYRAYAVNHETGHALGHQHAHACLPGGLAPVMMQQTLGLRAVDRRLCRANPWPYPPGVKGAPGSEGPDTPQNDEYLLGNE